MVQQIIEGTWEEIESRKEELVGCHLKVIVTQPPVVGTSGRTSNSHIPATAHQKNLIGFGAFKGKVGGSVEFAREKQEELDIEETRP